MKTFFHDVFWSVRFWALIVGFLLAMASLVYLGMAVQLAQYRDHVDQSQSMAIQASAQIQAQNIQAINHLANQVRRLTEENRQSIQDRRKINATVDQVKSEVETIRSGTKDSRPTPPPR